jgi:hypothetical protein
MRRAPPRADNKDGIAAKGRKEDKKRDREWTRREEGRTADERRFTQIGMGNLNSREKAFAVTFASLREIFVLPSPSIAYWLSVISHAPRARPICHLSFVICLS